MAGFWAGLGSGLENYAKNRMARSHLGKAIGLQPPDPSSPVQQPVQIGTGEQIGTMDRTPAMSPGVQDPSQTQPDSGLDWSGIDAFAGGTMVTKPTVAMIGEKGPEAVVPLTSQPGQKISPSMLGMGLRTRYRHVTGPNAIGRQAPVRSDLPLKPNTGVR